MTDADAEPVYRAGWNEQALFDAVSVCALFNFMNPIVEGCGIKPIRSFEDDTGGVVVDQRTLGVLTLRMAGVRQTARTRRERSFGSFRLLAPRHY